MRNLAGTHILFELPEAAVSPADLSCFPEDTIPVFYENDYLLREPNADYWRLSEYYLPQSTNCGCSAASAAMALNALRSRLAPDDPILTDRHVVASIGDPTWAARTDHDGGGVALFDLEQSLLESLERFNLDGSVRAFAPDAGELGALDALRNTLIHNESSPDSIMLAYFNQAVVTGDPEGGLHVSPIGAYNAEADRVLVMDVDHECCLPYWTSTETLLAALMTPDPKETGHLAEETGGCLLISAAAA